MHCSLAVQHIVDSDLKHSKQCRKNFDDTHHGKTKQISPELQARFQHGIDNEIHVLGTLVGRYRLCFTLMYIILKMGVRHSFFLLATWLWVVMELEKPWMERIMLRSNWNALCQTNHSQLMYITKFLYGIRYRYLARWQLKVVRNTCGECFARICSIPWKTTHKKPKWVNELRPALDEFIAHSDFVCEVPSLNTISCDCSETPALTVNTVCRDHHTTLEICGSKDGVTMQTVGIYVSQAMDAIKEAYEHARRPAKELLLTVVSDLDRQHQEETPHALPIMYNMGGFSLKMPSARALLNEAMSACEKNGMDVRVIAFDGQFAEISIEDESPSRPLTLCRLA